MVTNQQVPSPFVFKGKAEDGVNLFFEFHTNALHSQPLFRSLIQEKAGRVTFAQIRKSNQKVSLRSLMPAFHHRHMTVPLRSLYRKA